MALCTGCGRVLAAFPKDGKLVGKCGNKACIKYDKEQPWQPMPFPKT